MSMPATRSPSASPKSTSTTMTTPDQSPGNENDIWASDTESLNNVRRGDGIPRHEMLSDLPTVRRQHTTNGYREGLSVGKARVMQQGFDAGYPIGIAIALRAGTILGVLEGYMSCKSVPDAPEKKAALEKGYARAKEELAVTALMKGLNDDLISKAIDIPHNIEIVLSGWENQVVKQKASHFPQDEKLKDM